MVKLWNHFHKQNAWITQSDCNMYLKKKNFSNNWIVLTNISLMLYASKRQLKWYKFTNYQSYLAYFRNKRKLSNQNVNQWNMNWPLNKHFITFNLNFDFYDFVAKINYDRQPLFNHFVSPIQFKFEYRMHEMKLWLCFYFNFYKLRS